MMDSIMTYSTDLNKTQLKAHMMVAKMHAEENIGRLEPLIVDIQALTMILKIKN
jgi:hypothetical protein